MLIDSHCHVNFEAYEGDADEVIRRALDGQIWLINVGSNYESSLRSVALAEEHDQGVYAAVGLHPIHLAQAVTESVSFGGQAKEFTTPQEDFDYDKFSELCQSSAKIVALGETGLDYYYFDKFSEQQLHDAKEKQRQVLAQFIALGREFDLPLIFHCRGTKEDNFFSYDELAAILAAAQQDGGKQINGVVHCFTGTLEQANKFLDLGFYIGFTGIITFKKKVDWLWEIVKAVPLEKILVETDAPFLCPEPYRGQRNEPAYVEYVVRKVAELRGISPQEVALATTENARKLFGI